ncbi:MAG: hypothetical protein E6G69_12335 [Alphaproteobacteria bacterium]|nr:MAG: hypothetical protein E6G69_12335 [Alphaproteobacteria bacterium]
MTRLRTLTTLVAVASLTACTDYATFVTATNIGINADVKTQDVSIGYGRTELFTGPGYPEQGEAPRAVGYINSDLHVFQPHIRQLYATGDAAELVTTTLPYPPAPSPPTEPPYYGQRRALVFATGANVGLKLGFGAGTAPVPSSIKFGYNREEASVIPLRSDVPTEQHRDRYAPVLASMDMNLGGTATPAGTNLGITQFFATGSAARNLAARDDFRQYFQFQAKEAIKSASLTANFFYGNAGKKIEAFWKPNGAVDQANDRRIKICMSKYNLTGSVAFLINGRPEAEKDIVISCLQL